MYTRMLVWDFRRNRTIAVLLVVLMMLSVLLATASAGTLVRLVGASSALMARAGAPHVAQLHVGEYHQDDVDAWAGGRPEVDHHQTMPMLGIDGADLFLDGQDQRANIQQNALVVPNAERDLLLDVHNEPITAVEPGTIILPVFYDVETDIEIGDVVAITGAEGFRTELTVAGFARDSIMNPAIASSKRLAVSAHDYVQIAAHTGSVEYLITFWLTDPSAQSAAFEAAYLDAGLPKNGQMVNSATFQTLTMIGDGLVAAVVILVAGLLLVVAMLCLRFAFLAATENDHREIGVLKAIGIPTGRIKGLYLVKYTALAVIATGAGLFGGLGLIGVLTRDITHYMGTAASLWNWAVPAGAGLAVLVVLVGFVLVLLRRLNTISAVQALNGTGPAGRRARRRSRGHARTQARSTGRGAGHRRWPLRWSGRRRPVLPRVSLHRSRMEVSTRLGLMDVLTRAPAYLLLFGVFTISTFITIVPLSAAATAGSPGFIHYMGIGTIDLRADLRHTGAGSTADFDSAVDQLHHNDQVAALAPMITTRHATTDAEGNPASLYVQNGDHTQLPVTYAQGRAPTAPDEIALSLLALHQAGRQVGQSLQIQAGGQWLELQIVGSYQDITNGGRTAQAVLPTDGEEVMWYVIGIDLIAGADAAAAGAALNQDLAPATVADVQTWRAQTLGPVSDQLGRTALACVVVAIALAALMTAMFTRMLLARDGAQIAIQRAIGIDDAGLRRQYLTRILLVLGAGVVAGSLAAGTAGESMFNLMFEAMFGGFEVIGQGTSRIDFDVQPLLTVLAVPAALLTAVALATRGATRTIATRHIAGVMTG